MGGKGQVLEPLSPNLGGKGRRSWVRLGLGISLLVKAQSSGPTHGACEVVATGARVRAKGVAGAVGTGGQVTRLLRLMSVMDSRGTHTGLGALQ